MATTIFPHATGAALATAEAHKDPQDLIFYSGWVRYVRYPLANQFRAPAVLPVQPESLGDVGGEGYSISVPGSQPVQEGATLPRSVRSATRRTEPLTPADVNPKGLVPTVEVDGKALYESLVLCEFLEDAYPDRKPSMFPGDAYTKGHVRLWVSSARFLEQRTCL